MSCEYLLQTGVLRGLKMVWRPEKGLVGRDPQALIGVFRAIIQYTLNMTYEPASTHLGSWGSQITSWWALSHSGPEVAKMYETEHLKSCI